VCLEIERGDASGWAFKIEGKPEKSEERISWVAMKLKIAMSGRYIKCPLLLPTFIYLSMDRLIGTVKLYAHYAYDDRIADRNVMRC